MTQKVNHENTEPMYHFGHNFLFDGYLINHTINQFKILIFSGLLFDAYLTDKKFKCYSKRKVSKTSIVLSQNLHPTCNHSIINLKNDLKPIRKK